MESGTEILAQARDQIKWSESCSVSKIAIAPYASLLSLYGKSVKALLTMFWQHPTLAAVLKTPGPVLFVTKDAAL